MMSAANWLNVNIEEVTPMRFIKRRLCFSAILIVPLIAFTATHISGQTPDAGAKSNGTISGRVTIGQKAAAGIPVAVSNPNSGVPVGQTITDADGNYRVTGLPAGQVTVTPVAPVYVLPVAAYSGQPGRPVNLSASEVVEGIDFKLTRGGVITGRITDGEGKPVIEQSVSLMMVDENGAPARGPNFPRPNFTMYQTDDRGIYRIYGLPAGHYKVSAGADPGGVGMRPSGYFQKTFYPDESDVNRAAVVDVTEGGETKNIDIRLGRRGQTYTVSGRIIDADTNQPLSGVQYSIGLIQQNQNQSSLSSTSGPGTPTNSQGEFRMEGITPGRYVILINPARFNPTASGGPRVFSDPVPFEVLDGDVADLEVKAQRGLSISGVVVPDGITDRAILDRLSKMVVFANVDPGPNVLRTFNNTGYAQINSDWGFVLDGMRPGKVSINVAAFNAPQIPGLTVIRVEHNGIVHPRQIDLQPGQNISGVRVFVAYGTGVVRGQVRVDGGTLPNDAMLYVNLQGEPDRYGAQVDSRGNFVIKGIRAGTYEAVLQVNSWGAQTLPRGFARVQRQSITVAEGAETQVIFTLDLTPKEQP